MSSSFGAVPDLPTFWRDSLVAATAARLASRLGAEADLRHGLLHATGHLILCKTYPDIADFVFTGYAVARGAELAAIESENFGIDHAKVGALWVETIGFPQTVADTIRKVAEPLPASAGPLDLSLRSACALAEAVARKDESAAAWAALPPAVQRATAAAGPTRVREALDALQDRAEDVTPAPPARRQAERVRDALR